MKKVSSRKGVVKSPKEVPMMVTVPKKSKAAAKSKVTAKPMSPTASSTIKTFMKPITRSIVETTFTTFGNPSTTIKTFESTKTFTGTELNESTINTFISHRDADAVAAAPDRFPVVAAAPDLGLTHSGRGVFDRPPQPYRFTLDDLRGDGTDIDINSVEDTPGPGRLV